MQRLWLLRNLICHWLCFDAKVLADMQKHMAFLQALFIFRPYPFPAHSFVYSLMFMNKTLAVEPFIQVLLTTL
jgi:hypothetical protein